MLIECYSLFILSGSILIAYLTDSIPYLPTELSRIVGTKPAYYFFLPNICLLSYLIYSHLVDRNINFYLNVIVVSSLIGLALFDHYSFHTIHCICAFSFFSFGLIILFPIVINQTIGLYVFILRLLLLPLQNFLLTQPIETNLIFRIRALLQWLLVYCLLYSFSYV